MINSVTNGRNVHARLFTAETKEVERVCERERVRKRRGARGTETGGSEIQRGKRGGRETQAEHARPEKIDERDAGKSTLI